ncbi:MAG: helix-turn-helix domain-containing protein [Steroidobacteraceae bacterium]
MNPTSQKTYTMDELAFHSDTPRRTIRYYIQLGLVDRPVGETRAAHYTQRHFEQLAEIHALAKKGLSLERIAQALGRSDAPPIPPGPPPGSLAVRTHLALAPGLDLVIDPGIAELTPEQLRAFARDCLAALARAKQGTP